MNQFGELRAPRECTTAGGRLSGAIRPEPCQYKINESPQLRGRSAVWEIDQVHGPGGQFIVGKHSNQPPGANILGEQHAWLLDDTQAS